LCRSGNRQASKEFLLLLSTEELQKNGRIEINQAVSGAKSLMNVTAFLVVAFRQLIYLSDPY
jgi:hypothetical protein